LKWKNKIINKKKNKKKKKKKKKKEKKNKKKHKINKQNKYYLSNLNIIIIFGIVMWNKSNIQNKMYKNKFRKKSS